MNRRACFLLPHLRPSGGVRHILELAAGLSAKGWDVRIWVIMRRGGDPPPAPWARFESLLASPGSSATRPVIDYAYGDLRALRPRVDEVIVTYGDAPNEVFLGSYLRDTPAVLLVLDWLYFRPEAQRRYLLQGNWSAIATSSYWLAENVGRLLGGYEPWVIGGGVGEEFYADPDSDLVATAREEGYLKIGSLYSPIPGKGWEDVLKVTRILRGRLKELRGVGFYSGSDYPHGIKLLTFGSEHLPPGTFDRMNGLPMMMSHTVTPDAAKLRQIYSDANVWISTSRSEGYGFVALEALACGTPVITYDNGGCGDFITDGHNGYKVEHSPESVADAVVSALSDAKRYHGMSFLARSVRKSNAWSNVVDRMEECLVAVTS